jgi:hypothetical protein
LREYPLLTIIEEPAARPTVDHPVMPFSVRHPQLGDSVKELVLFEFSAKQFVF